MTSTATTRNRLEKQETGDNNNTWGSVLNASLIDLVDAALDGRVSFALSGSKTLTSTNYAADESRMRFIDVTGGSGGTVTIPAVEKLYFVRNASSGDVVVTAGGATTATVKSGNVMWVACDGSDMRLGLASDFGAVVPKSSGTPSVNSHLTNKLYVDTQVATAATGTTLASGVATFLATPSSANLVAAMTDETGTGALVFANAPTLVDPVVGTQSQGDNSTKAASTAYVDIAIGDLGWVQLATSATTSGTTATFSSLSQDYSELLVVFEAVSHNGGATQSLDIELSSDGSTWSTPVGTTTAVASSISLYGSLSVPRYTGNQGAIYCGIVNLTSSPKAAQGGAANSTLAWRCAGISDVRFSWSGGASFDAGTITVYARQ